MTKAGPKWRSCMQKALTKTEHGRSERRVALASNASPRLSKPSPYDRYGHLMPGHEAKAAALLDAYFERANTRARLVALED